MEFGTDVVLFDRLKHRHVLNQIKGTKLLQTVPRSSFEEFDAYIPEKNNKPIT